MLTILLQPNSSEPLYRQLCCGIQEKIMDGSLKPGEKLPSRRALAAHLQVSMTTVQSTYEQLAAEGILCAKPRVGYFVDMDALLLLRKTDSVTPPVPCPAKPTDADSGITFATGGVDLEQFPFSTWAKLSRQVLTNQQELLLKAVPPMGLYALRAEIAAHLRAFRGISVSPEQILVGAGTEYLLGLLVQLLSASRRYAAEEPGYSKTKQILRAHGASVLNIPVDINGMCPDALRQSGATVAHVTPSHHFPTGTVMPVRRRAELLQWAASHEERYIIEDDYDSELRFIGKPLPPLFSLDKAECVIYMNTFARTLSPSLRIGYMLLPLRLVQKFQQDFSFYSCTVPSFEQYTLAQFMHDGCFERHLNRMKKTYRLRQEALTAALLSHPMAKYLKICGKEAGLFLLLEVHLPYTEQVLINAARLAGVTVFGLSCYYEHPEHAVQNPPKIVMGYACLTVEAIEAGVKLLLDAWEKLLNE